MGLNIDILPVTEVILEDRSVLEVIKQAQNIRNGTQSRLPLTAELLKNLVIQISARDLRCQVFDFAP